MFDDYSNVRREQTAFRGADRMGGPWRITIEFPITCPMCKQEITGKDNLKACRGTVTDEVHLEHRSMGCCFRLRDLEGQQLTLDDVTEG